MFACVPKGKQKYSDLTCSLHIHTYCPITFSKSYKIHLTLSEKRYKSCHWGCTFSKGKLLSILCANLYILQ